MIKNKFWIHFSSAYGTIWAVLLTVALVTKSHIDIGQSGAYGFPILCLFYALYKRNKKTPAEVENEQLRRENAHLKEMVHLLKKEQE